MKKTKLFSIILALALSAQFLTAAVSAKLVEGVSGIPAKTEKFVQPLSIPTNLPKGNKLSRSNFDTIDCISESLWSKMTAGMLLEWKGDANGGYLHMGNIPYNYYGFRFNPLFEVVAGKYKFTGYFRTYNKDEVTSLRIEFNDADSNAMKTLYVNCGNEWQYVEAYVDLPSDLLNINFCGAGYVEFFQDYCIDEVALVEVDSIPDSYVDSATKTFGPAVDRAEALRIMYENIGGFSDTFDPETYYAKYETNGIMLNNDADGTLHGVGRTPDGVTEDTIIEAAMQYKDTQVTDFMLTVCNEIATYPSLVWTSYLDKYYQKEENGQEVDWSNEDAPSGAQYIYEELNTDHIGLWAEIFPEIGINPWLSFRMNDAHERNVGVSWLMSDFFHENPHLYRVKHHNYVSYMDKIYDYTYVEVRDHFLALINEALSRYDVYGIELDFQREIFVWHIGGEYNGLDIMNQFFRDVDDIVAIYEEKYGHEIKIAARVASDPMTNYELGLDVATWAAEDILDHLTVTGRFECTDFDMPIRLWKSILSPFGVTLAAGIDTSYVRHAQTQENAGWTTELYAGFCANAYSQGADKIYILNMNTGVEPSYIMKESDRVTIGNKAIGEYINSNRWVFVSNMGSYDKVLEMNRRCTVTYRDTDPVWRSHTYVLPTTIVPGTTKTLRIPVGDITIGSRVTLEMSVPEHKLGGVLPKVYVNSQLCTYVDAGMSRPGGVGTFTLDPVLRYDVPVEAQDETYMVVEIMYDGAGGFTVEHLEIYIEPLG